MNIPPLPEGWLSIDGYYIPARMVKDTTDTTVICTNGKVIQRRESR